MTFRTMFGGLIFCGMVMLAGAAPPPPTQAKPPKSRVTALVGKVVDADGKLAVGAEVRLDSEPRTDRPQTTLAKTKTAQDGTFRIERIPPGKNYVLSASLLVKDLTA